MSVRSIGPRRATLAGEVRGELERMIVDGDLKAGEKMNELALSEVMGVSRGTVREAIRSLADSGLIDLIANRGAYVHETTLAEVRNLYDLRGAVFAMACSSAARRVAEGVARDVPKTLERNLDQMRTATAKEDTARYYKLNIEFHDMLLGAADNPKAKTIYDNLVKEMHLFRRRGLSVPTNMERSLAEHEAISAAVIGGDVDGARAAAHLHITSGFARYMKMLEQEPDAAG
ncbi:MAG: GntR family transcriptional regulator [Rhodobacteraceae bacterium]|nr:GntR family transcriptional regulator [Paracoccaceae bacterium]